MRSSDDDNDMGGEYTGHHVEQMCGEGALRYHGVYVSAEMVEEAIRLCKKRKTCGRYRLVAEVWQELALSDARWSAAIASGFNQRLENSGPQTGTHAARHARHAHQACKSEFGGADFWNSGDFWHCIDVSLLPKASPPQQIKMLRPISVLPTSVSKLLEGHTPDLRNVRYRAGRATKARPMHGWFPENVTSARNQLPFIRALVERSTEWSLLCHYACAK